jgi:pimeloyl-ACP methyl ester carboxylesterase
VTGTYIDGIHSNMDLYLLPHTAVDPSDGQVATATILFIHGAFSSRGEWDLVVPFLGTASKENYHLLLPDLLCHGEAKGEQQPGDSSSQDENRDDRQSHAGFSVRHSSKLLAHLIRQKAIGGRAKIVGLSLGAILAIDLASTFPDVVDEAVFVSGYEVFPALSSSGLAPYGLWMMKRIENAAPRSLVKWLMDGADIHGGSDSEEPKSQSEVKHNGSSLALCRDIVAAISGSGSGQGWPPQPWPARTLIVVAGKRGILPSNDHPEDAKKLAGIGRELNADTVAMTHPLMRHPWNIQDPKLFAETTCAWFERRPIPDGFEPL